MDHVIRFRIVGQCSSFPRGVRVNVELFGTVKERSPAFPSAESGQRFVWVSALIHEDPNVIDRALNNPIVKWFSACFGRFNQAHRAAYGIDSAFPHDWLPAFLPESDPDISLKTNVQKMAKHVHTVNGCLAPACASLQSAIHH